MKPEIDVRSQWPAEGEVTPVLNAEPVRIQLPRPVRGSTVDRPVAVGHRGRKKKVVS